LFSHFERDGLRNQIIVIDNVRFHHSSNIRELILRAGHRLLYLPPYSPFLNLIENLFSKRKEIIQQMAPNNEQDLFSAINTATTQISNQNCRGFYNNMLRYILKSNNREKILD
ncbi:putative Mariner transposable element, partial [Pseudoloma neurophilia]